MAGIEGPGWLPRLTEEQARNLGVATIGLFKMSGVDWARVFPLPHTAPVLVEPSGASSAGPEPDGHDGLILRDRRRLAASRGEGEPASTTTLLPFHTVVVTWRRWVEAWEREQAGTSTRGASSRATRSSPARRPHAADTPARRSGTREPHESGDDAESEAGVTDSRSTSCRRRSRSRI